MDEGLEGLAQKWEQKEKPEEREKPEVKNETSKKVEEPEPVNEAAVNAGVWLTKGIELGWKAKEPRLAYTEGMIAEAAEGFAPLLDKYGVGAGSGSVPFAEEIGFGWSLGRLMKKSWLFVKAKAAEDAKKRKDQEQAKQEEQPATQAAPVDPYGGMFSNG